MEQPADQVETAPRPKSDYRGLSWDRKHAGWRVRIYYRSKQRHIGRYTDEIEAAKAYDKAAYYLYGEAAITNFGIYSAREDKSQVSEFILQAKQQVQANDQRQGLHQGPSNSMAMQHLFENGLLHMQQQSHLCSTGEMVLQPHQQYTPSVMTAVGSTNAGLAMNVVAPPNRTFHASSSYSHLGSPAVDISTLQYANSACMAAPVASTTAVAQPQMVLVPTPAVAAGAAAVQPAVSAAASWMDGSLASLHRESSPASHSSSQLMSTAPTVLQQQQQHFQQFMMSPAAGAGAAVSLTSVPLPLGVQSIAALPLMPPKLPLQQQQAPQLYDAAGTILWQTQQQQVRQSPPQQVMFYAQSEPVQLSGQPQLISIAGPVSLSTSAATSATGSPVPKAQQGQMLLESRLQNVTLLDGPTYSPPATQAQQVFTAQLGSGAAAPPTAAAVMATGMQAAAGMSGGAALPPLSAPFAGSMLLQPGKQQQGGDRAGYFLWN